MTDAVNQFVDADRIRFAVHADPPRLVPAGPGWHLVAGDMIVARAWPAEAVRGRPWSWRSCVGSHNSAATVEEFRADALAEIGATFP